MFKTIVLALNGSGASRRAAKGGAGLHADEDEIQADIRRLADKPSAEESRRG